MREGRAQVQAEPAPRAGRLAAYLECGERGLRHVPGRVARSYLQPVAAPLQRPRPDPAREVEGVGPSERELLERADAGVDGAACLAQLTGDARGRGLRSEPVLDL